MTWRLQVTQAPERWERTRLRSFLNRCRDTGRPDLPLLSVNLSDGVVLRRVGDGRPNPAEDLSRYQVVRRGDLVVNQLGKPHGAVGISSYEGIISPAYFIARVGERAAPRFVHHLLRTGLYISEYERRGKYMPPSQFDISWEQFRAIPVALPSVSEQRAIADFLDTETSRIDALITKKRHMIAKFEERRRALLTAVLAGGADPGTLLRANGVEARPLKRSLQRTIAGGTPDTANGAFWSEDGHGVPWVAIGDMVDLGRTDTATKRVTPEGLKAAHLEVGPPETVLFAMYASMGKLTVANSPLTWNQAIIGLVPDASELDSEYLALWLEVLRPHLRLLARSTTQDNLNAEQVGALPIPNLSLRGQQEVVAEVQGQLRTQERIAGVLARQLDLLQERRQALITAAVTGDLEVPEVAA